MQPFPHHYSVVAKAHTQGDVALEGERLPSIPSAPPTEFGGLATDGLRRPCSSPPLRTASR
jgi:hypothetical protein